MRAARHHVDLHQRVEIGQCAAPEANEPRRVEASFQIFQPVGDRVPRLLHGKHVEQFPFRHDRGDVLDADEGQLVAPADGNSIEESGTRIGLVRRRRGVQAAALVRARRIFLAAFHSFVRPVQRVAQPRLVDGLQQVVDGVQLEGPHRVFLVSRDERDQRHFVLLEGADHAEPVELGHVQVEQRQVRLLLHDQRHRLPARIRFADDADVVEAAEERGEERSRRPLVVGDHDAEGRCHRARSSTARSAGPDGAGTVTSTSVTPGVSLWIWSVPSVP